MDNSIFNVCIRCNTYNHSKYILDALNGFVHQQTSFPFIVFLQDDASNDGEQDIIRSFVKEQFEIDNCNVAYNKETEYAYISYAQHKINKNCFILVHYLKFNHYQIGKQTLHYLGQWRNNIKYEAICEGDDYWTDPLKLQKQVEFMEHHPDYTMCCTDAVISAGHKELDWKRYYKNCQIPTKDIIMGGGLFIQTATLLYRLNLVLDGTYPESAKKCHVGDYPLQIFAALNGKVYWFSEKTSVYRYQVENSWTHSNKTEKCNDNKVKGWQSEITMLKEMDHFSKRVYHDVFNKRIATYVFEILCGYPSYNTKLVQIFKEEIKLLSCKQKLRIYLLRPVHSNLYIFLSKIYHIFH